MSFLEVKNLNFSYSSERPILTDVGLSLEKGEIGVLLGSSGSGKTTLLRSLAGFEKPQSGLIRINRNIVFDTNTYTSAEKRKIGFLFQSLALFPHLNVEENILFGISNKSKSEQNSRLNELLQLINLKDYNLKKIAHLSGGEKQRVALARSLAPHPTLLLMDEPFSSLDPELRAHMRQEIRQILRSQNMTALVVTHDHHEAYDLADKVGLIENGRLKFWGLRDEYFKLEQQSRPVLKK